MDPWLLTTLKISLKSALKKIPGAGWAMQCGGFMFLDRKFESDKDWIRKLIKYYSEAGSSYQVDFELYNFSSIICKTSLHW